MKAVRLKLKVRIAKIVNGNKNILTEKIIIVKTIAIKVFFKEIILKRNEFFKVSFKDNFTVVNKGKLYINEKSNIYKLHKIELLGLIYRILPAIFIFVSSKNVIIIQSVGITILLWFAHVFVY